MKSVLMMVIVLFAGILACPLAPAQELVISTGGDQGPSPLVVFPDFGNQLAGSTPIYIAPTQPYTVNPHGFALLGPTTAVASKFPAYDSGYIGVDVIDIANSTLTASFNPGGVNDMSYSGAGAVSVNPSGSYVLLTGGATGGATNNAKTWLWVVPTPLSAMSIASDILILPGYFGSEQTHAIAFDQTTGRAYVAHSTGITAIDPPYDAASIAFTITLPVLDFDTNGSDFGRSVSLSPDQSTLLTTTGGANPGANLVTIIHAPFSAASTHEDLTLDQAISLDAVAFVPDGSQALVVDQRTAGTTFQAQVFAISAPYSASSLVEWLQLPAGGPNTDGFEDLDISPNGQIAALAGGCLGGCPFVVLHAPFTAAGFSVETMNVPNFDFPYFTEGRGPGTAHFWPTPISPLPQLTIDRISVTEGNSGTTPATFTVSLSGVSAQTVSVQYATLDGTAFAGTDYVATSGTLTFAPGQLHRTVTVLVNGDTLNEPDKIFRVVISNPLNATVLDSPLDSVFNPIGYDGVCIIVDDDSGNPTIVTDSPLADAYVGVPYTQTFTLANYSGTPGWFVDAPNLNLPGGLAMNPTTGVLSGVPAEAGSYYFVVYLSGLSLSREYHLIVRDDRIFADNFDVRQ